jgi:hypothetical protein
LLGLPSGLSHETGGDIKLNQLRHHFFSNIMKSILAVWNRGLRDLYGVVPGLGLVYTEGFLIEEVSGCGEGTRPASHADVAELAAATLTFEIAGVAKLVENDRVTPDIGEILFAQVASDDRKISAGINFALERDEADASSGEASLSSCIHVGGMAPGMSGWLERDSRAAGHDHLRRADVRWSLGG